ncbi:hypothetical protein SLS53_008128 [Cytospora paraplurivora]|uniref:Secreted protein n=1 Tax=Cytospora paraplurivora TaxID=2898453 RepID=A0AAN9YD24_9PEZI
MLTRTVIFIAAAIALLGMCQAAPWLEAVQQYSRGDTIGSGISSGISSSNNNNPNLTKIICRPQMYVEARVDHTNDGIDYLRHKPQDPLGPPYFPPRTNGGHCTRVSCEYASAIYLCNDNDHGVQVPTGTIADYVQAVLDDGGERCHFWDGDYGGTGFSKDVVWGQAFDANGW